MPAWSRWTRKPGKVEILDYVIVEDCGRMVNPMVVEGQTYGGAAQGIGTALYEEVLYDDNAQPLTSTLADYILPGPTELPMFRIEHMETLSPHTEFGMKGVGEGGAIAPPAAIFNAVNDAIRPLGAEVAETPLTPHRLLAALAQAESRRPVPPAAHARKSGGTMKAAAFAYQRAASLAERSRACGQCGRRRQGAWAAASRWGRCSTCAWCAPRCWSTYPALAGPAARSSGSGGSLFIGGAADPCGNRGWRARCGAVAGAAPLARMLRHVAGTIAYRAVRNRGTLAGSLAHADPAADWVLAMTALDAQLQCESAGRHAAGRGDAIHVRRLHHRACGRRAAGRRCMLPQYSADMRWGYYKFCRKTGEFAEASCAVVFDPQRGVARIVIGALDGAPALLPGLAAQVAQRRRWPR